MISNFVTQQTAADSSSSSSSSSSLGLGLGLGLGLSLPVLAAAVWSYRHLSQPHHLNTDHPKHPSQKGGNSGVAAGSDAANADEQSVELTIAEKTGAAKI